MIINIGLNTGEISKAITQLQEYNRKLCNQEYELSRQLAEDGKVIAEACYGMVEVDDGNGSVTVTVEPRENGYAIVASGKGVAFREFGAGAMAQSGKFEELSTFPGAWSRDHARKYYKDGYWHYYGKRYTYIEPMMGLQRAGEEIRRKIAERAKEVYGK